MAAYSPYDAYQQSITQDQAILAGYQKRYEEAMSKLRGLGTQQREDVTQDYKNVLGKAKQSLMTSGLYRSTAMPSVMLGVQKQKDAAMRRLNERLTTQQLGYETQLTGDTLQYQAASQARMPTAMQLAGYEQQQWLQGFQQQQANQATADRAAQRQLELQRIQQQGIGQNQQYALGLQSLGVQQGRYSNSPRYGTVDDGYQSYNPGSIGSGLIQKYRSYYA